MSDQCANCDVRGHFDKCEGVECGHHENWYPNELKKQLVAAEQRIDELLSANGSLQYKNDRLTAKTQRLEVAEKMAREARAQLAAAEQRAETLKDERACVSGPIDALCGESYPDGWPHECSNSELLAGCADERPSVARSYRQQMYYYFAKDLPQLTDQQICQVYKYMRSLRAGIKRG